MMSSDDEFEQVLKVMEENTVAVMCKDKVVNKDWRNRLSADQLKIKEEILAEGGFDAEGQLINVKKALGVNKGMNMGADPKTYDLRWDDSDDDSMEGGKNSDVEMGHDITAKAVLDSLEIDFLEAVSTGEHDDDPPAFWESVLTKFKAEKNVANTSDQQKYDALIQGTEQKIKEIVLKIAGQQDKIDSDEETVIASTWETVKGRKRKNRDNQIKISSDNKKEPGKQKQEQSTPRKNYLQKIPLRTNSTGT